MTRTPYHHPTRWARIGKLGIRLNSLLRTLFLSLVLLSTSCASLVKVEQPVMDRDFLLDSQSSIGQTGMARYDGLEGVCIYLQPHEPGDGSIKLLLRARPESNENLAETSLALEQVHQAGYYDFNFSPIGNTTAQDIFILLKVEGNGSVKISAAPGNTYLNGALYYNKIPQDAQMAFKLAYNPPSAAAGLLREAWTWLLYILSAIFLFVLPGWALLSALWPGWKSLDWMTRLGLSAGASLPLYPLLLLWTNLVGLQLGVLYAWIPAGVAALYLVIINRNTSQIDLKSGLRRFLQPQNLPWADVAFLIAVGLLILVRFWEVRSLDIPMWGDSYQHTVMAQLLVDHGGLFQSWHPYAESLTFSYHFGFHSLAAVFHWLTGATLPKSTLWTGQITNILAVISLAPLAIRLGRNRWAGAAAVLLAGLLLQMPNFYTNWGRYTQLAGQVILVAAIWLLCAFFEEKHKTWPSIIALWLIFAGLAITHYRVTLMAGLFILAYWLLYARKWNFKLLFLRTTATVMGALVLFLPWFLRAFSSNLADWLNTMLNIRLPQSGNPVSQVAELGNLSVYLPAYFWWALFFFIAWGLWRKEKGVALISAWWLLTYLAGNPAWLGLPGKDILNSFAVLIAIYIPASILIGSVIVGLVQTAWGYFSAEDDNTGQKPVPAEISSGSSSGNSSGTSRGISRWLSLALFLVFTAAAVLGSRKRLYDINPLQHSLAARPDLRAADWIRQNTPTDTSFLVNSLFAYDNTVIAGTDGGWWLPLLAGRSTSLPPLTYSLEKGPVEDYRSWINKLPALILEKGITHPEVLDLLQERGHNYIYIGQQQGSVNHAGTFLDINTLASDPHFFPVYHQDRVWIFKILFDE